MSCIFKVDYNTITVFEQELIVNEQTINRTSQYIKKALDKIRRGLFKDIMKMLISGATSEQVWQYQMEEIRRVYALKKMKKAIRYKGTRTYTFKQMTIAINRGTTREYSSSAKRRSSNTLHTSSGDSGDPDQPPQPPRPPRPTHLTTPQRNRYSHSWQTTPGLLAMVGGGLV